MRVRRWTKRGKIRLLKFAGFGLLAFYIGGLQGFLGNAPRLYTDSIEALDALEFQERKMREAEDELAMQSPENLQRSCGEVMENSAKATPGLFFFAIGNDTVCLVDKGGKVKHRWYIPYIKMFPERARFLPGRAISIQSVLLLPNGDVLAIYFTESNITDSGYGLVRVDRNSKLLWRVEDYFHHDIYQAHDGRIWVPQHDFTEQSEPGLEALARPTKQESIYVISPEGKIDDVIRLGPAFIDTPFEDLFFKGGVMLRDVMHTNSVQVLEEDIAARFPMFKAGQILVSMRERDAIAVIDPHTHKAVWALDGVWKGQHRAVFLPNGHIMLFDNRGEKDISSRSTRLLEIDPMTQEVVWSYGGTDDHPFYSRIMGSQQLLRNDQIMILQPGIRRMFEITRDGEVVWQYKTSRRPSYNFTMFERPDELTFLNDRRAP